MQRDPRFDERAEHDQDDRHGAEQNGVAVLGALLAVNPEGGAGAANQLKHEVVGDQRGGEISDQGADDRPEGAIHAARKRGGGVLLDDRKPGDRRPPRIVEVQPKRDKQ